MGMIARIDETLPPLRKSETRRGLRQLRAPVDGTVQQLGVHTLGGVVQPAPTRTMGALMVIVPEQGDLIVEAQLLNKDRGFVREGQRVRVIFRGQYTD